jgi:hypothetical protein
MLKGQNCTDPFWIKRLKHSKIKRLKMQNLLLIISCACLAILIAETSGLVQWIKFKLNFNRLKPLDCPMCLAWWIALILFVFQRQFLIAPLFAATSSIIAIFISKMLRK